MNYYIITTTCTSDQFIVKAKNKKEALEIIWDKWFKGFNEEFINEGYEPIYKKEINIVSLKEYDEELEQDGFAMLL